jgi:hypothetical protein
MVQEKTVSKLLDGLQSIIAYQWWEKVYLHLRLWLSPIGKSPGEAYEHKVLIFENG